MNEHAVRGKAGEEVPAVDPEDLKAVWRMYEECRKAHPREQFAVAEGAVASLCKPAANIQAVGYRNAQLGLIRIMVEQEAMPAEALTPLLKDGEFTEASFRAMAMIPMEWMEVGVVRQELPYDFDELLRLAA